MWVESDKARVPEPIDSISNYLRMRYCLHIGSCIMSAWLVSLMEVPTGVVTVQEFARHSSHEANKDFLALLWNSKAGIKVVYEV